MIKPMSKHELDYKKLQLNAHKFGRILDSLKSFATLGTILGCVYIIFDGLKVISTSNPAGVSAIAEVVKNLNISGIMSYVVAAGCAGGWAMERSGKKRLLKKSAESRKRIEENDAYTGSSGLTESGDTPDQLEVN